MENLASTSSSCQSAISVYDVFINHRGPDVKTTLAEPLYHRLRDDLHLQVFLDKEELQMGDFIPSSISHAIKNASVHIAVFSKNYAQSPWCLEELCLMLSTGAVILPVFYDIEPSALRWIESGVYADAFRGHERKKRYDPQTLQKWKQALKDVSFRSGLMFDSTSNRDHRSLLQRIVNSVSKHVKVGLEVADHPVGLDEEIENFETKLAEYENHGENAVKVVGIVGMVGSGKTTLAKELHNRKRREYGNGSCFVFDVRVSSANKGLDCLQSKLLEELGLLSGIIYNSGHGKEVLRRQLRGKRVLLVLDDIDHVNQLEALLVKDVLGSDSLVLVTSRYRDVLVQCGISILYQMKGMNPKNAKELFCWHAFLRRDPMNGFEDLVERFLAACGGLPLSLKVIGRQLCGKLEKAYWEGELPTIPKRLHAYITNPLKISYDALDQEQQEVLLDIACLFRGEDKDKVVSIWEGSGWNGLHALQILQDKCLVDSDENCLRMHDHVRDMGRDIAKSAQRPRLQRRNDNENDRSNFLELIKRPSEDALLEMIGSRIINELVSYHEGSECKTHVLQFLVVDGDCTTHKFVKLLWLKWWNCPYRRIPSFLSMENLRVLEIEGSSSLEELWDDRTSQAPLYLRELHVTDCPKFQKIPKSIGRLRNLEKLVLRSPYVLGPGLEMGLPNEFCCLQSLKHLELCRYKNLKSLPIRFGDLTNLQHLDLSGCSKLQVLPNSFSQLTQLQYLSLEYCSRLIVPQAMFGNISTLEHVDFRGCCNFEVLAVAITRQRYLRTLYFRCNQLPDEIGELRNLEVLEVGGEFLTMLPSSLGSLCRLKTLKLSQCERLRCLPESVGLLKRLQTLEISYSGVDRLPEAVAHLNNLQELYIYHSPIRKMTLRKSELSDDGYMFRLKDIVLKYTKTKFISISEDVCPNLQTLVIQECRKLKEVELALPTTLVSLQINNCRTLKTITWLSDLAKLRRLDISGCAEVEKLPNLAHLTSLNKLVTKRCGKLQNVEGVGHLSSLKVLNVDGCWKLQGIEGLGLLQGLNRLQISLDNWTDIEGLQRSCAASSASIVTMRQVAESATLMESIVNSFSFPLTVKKRRFSPAASSRYDDDQELELKLSEMEVNTCSALITCILFKAAAYTGLRLQSGSGGLLFETVVEEGQWINLSVLTKNSRVVSRLKAASDEMRYMRIPIPCDGSRLEIKEAWTVLGGDMLHILQLWRKFLHRLYWP